MASTTTKQNGLDTTPAQEFVEGLGTVADGKISLDRWQVASLCHGKVVVDQSALDLFAAQLHAEVQAGKVPVHVYKAFVEGFGGNAGVFVE